VLDINDEGKPDVILFSQPMALALKETNDAWNLLGDIENANCKGASEVLREGKFGFAPPESKRTQGSRPFAFTPFRTQVAAHELAFSTVTARRFCDQQEMSLHTATGRSLP